MRARRLRPAHETCEWHENRHRLRRKASTFNFHLRAPVLVCASRPFSIQHPVMSTEVKIPALGESISSGLISKWHKNDGETVKTGDVLLTLETDKVAQEIAAEVSGVLRQKAKEGDDVAVGALVAVIEEGGGQEST